MKEKDSGIACISRRGFVAGAVSAASAARVAGANDRIRLGIIGTGGRGTWLMKKANNVGGHEWVAVCDAWDVRRKQSAELAGGNVDQFADYRKLLDRKDIDAVIVATLDHLHCKVAVDALRAGKDVYVEKPMTAHPAEGHLMSRAVRETNRVLQVGMQQRSMPHMIEAKQRFFDSGLIGQVNMVRTVWNANAGYLYTPPPGMETKPEGLDWKACLGDLPEIPWDPKRYFNRFAYWDFATGGQTGGLFVHWVDVVHWYLGLHQAKSAVALGGIYRYKDGRDTPDNINAVVEYPGDLNVTFEATLTDLIAKDCTDILFFGSGGRLSVRRSGYHFLPSRANAQLGEITATGSGDEPHMANWFECIRSRKQPNANVVEGHYSAMACHLVNIAYREKSRAEWRQEWDL